MMMMLANGIQGAGPELDPLSFQRGLRSMPKRPPSPRWTLGGGYDIGDWSYIDYMTMVWWDPDYQHPGGSGLPGAYRHLFNGCMYTYDQLPTEPAPFQQEGVATPAEAEAVSHLPCPNEPSRA
jgi:hypothetical protein